MTYPRLPLRWVFAAFAAVGIVGAVTRIAFDGGGDRAAAALAHGLFVWLLFGVLSPIALEAARRFPLRREPRRSPC